MREQPQHPDQPSNHFVAPSPDAGTGCVAFASFMRESTPVLIKLPEIDFVDDKEGKPIAIHSRIGRRPIAAFGNSDGDLQRLPWSAAGSRS